MYVYISSTSGVGGFLSDLVYSMQSVCCVKICEQLNIQREGYLVRGDIPLIEYSTRAITNERDIPLIGFPMREISNERDIQ